jgi:type II secretory pathway component GspD/PulD (secretin)
MIPEGYSIRLLLCLAPFAGRAAARAQTEIPDDPVTLNFVNADIESTIKAVGLIPGKNFLIDPKVKGAPGADLRRGARRRSDGGLIW